MMVADLDRLMVEMMVVQTAGKMAVVWVVDLALLMADCLAEGMAGHLADARAEYSVEHLVEDLVAKKAELSAASRAKD